MNSWPVSVPAQCLPLGFGVIERGGDSVLGAEPGKLLPNPNKHLSNRCKLPSPSTQF